MSMRTVIVLQLGEVGVLGLPVGGRLDGVGGVGDLGGGGLRLLLADDDGDRGLSRLAVRELQQVEVVGGHRGGCGGGGDWGDEDGDEKLMVEASMGARRGCEGSG